MASVGTTERDCRCEFELLSTYNLVGGLDKSQSKREVYNLSCAQAAIFLGGLAKHSSQAIPVEGLYLSSHLVTKLTLTDGADTYVSDCDSPDIAIKKIELFVENPKLVPTLVPSEKDLSNKPPSDNDKSGIGLAATFIATIITSATIMALTPKAKK